MENKVRIGILSTAEIAHKVYQAISVSSNAVAYAVASRSLEKARQWADAHNIAIAYGSYDELLNDPNVDAVYIPLPTSLKREWTIKAAKAKKHVLVEKPLPGVDTPEDIKAMIDACFENNVQFLDGTMWVHSKRTQDISQRKKELGQIRIVTAALTFKAPSEEWLQGGNGRTNKNQEPQGCLGDQGWYPIISILFAYDFELPQRVQLTFTQKNKVDTIIQASGFLQFSNNRIAYFDCGVTVAHRSNLEIIGENGVIRVDDLVGGQGKSGKFNAYFENFTGSERYFHDDVSGKEQVIQVEPCNHTQLMIEKFAELSKNVDHTWGQRSLAVQTVLAALYKSDAQGGVFVQI
ncbi:hypothetical protein pb186bvf_016950 [Paramecium bursaria]